MSYDHQDWTPVVIRSSGAAKKANQQKQNPTGTKEFHKLNEEEMAAMNKSAEAVRNMNNVLATLSI